MSQVKFQNKYRISSARAQWWDYGWNGAYFITICTQDREHYFGEIQNDKMVLSQVGVIADILWHQIPAHHKNIELGDFVVMPNHIHGILIIDKQDNVIDDVDTGHALSVPPQHRFQNIGKSTISSIIGSYKSAVTKHANRLGYQHQWQKLFYDIIISDNNAYQKISDYIVSNPENWGKDKFKTDDKSKLKI